MTKASRVMLAVLAVCGTSAAMAQSSVNLYGRINTTVEHHKLGNTSATGMVSSSSYIGFRGTEDLGNGLKASFILESSFKSDDGGNAMSFGRQSEINLSGGFGTIRLGNFDGSSLYAVSDPVSMHNHDTGTSADVFANYYLMGGNKVAYVTPEFNGFTFEAQYQFGEKAKVNNLANSEDKGGYDLALSYSNGPLAAGLGYSQAKKNFDNGANYEKAGQIGGFAAYEIGSVTVAGYYQKQSVKEVNKTSKRDVYRLAAKYALGASEFHANVGRATAGKVNGVKEGKSATQWTLAYNYNMSKRTKLYGFYTNINNTSADDISAPSTSFISNTNAYQKFRAYGIGVRHLF